MRTYFHFVKIFFWSLLIFLLAIVVIAPFWVVNTGKNNIYQKQADIPAYRVGIVFGAGITTRGEPKEMLKHRLDVAAELYDQKKLKKILVSGDNRVAEYNEPAAMFSYLTEEKNIPAEDVIRDYAGRRTYDTCIRARDIWGVKKALIITQGYHAIRAVFTCNALGIESTGFSATRNTYARERDFKMRELFAIYKAMIDIYIWTPEYVGGRPEQNLESDEQQQAQTTIAATEKRPTHNAFLGSDDFYDKAFSVDSVRNQSVAEEKNIPAIIVNHHLLAPNLIAQTFKSVSHLQPSTIVLISPNHFGVGGGALLTSDYDWNTPYGTLPANQSLIKKLTAQTNLKIDEVPFENEHGIFNIVTFIKGTFPDANIVPIIIKDIVPVADAKNFADALAKILPHDALVVGSFDFSHYLPENIALFHDAQTQNMLETLDMEYAYNADIDSRPGLTTLLEYADAKNAQSFVTLKRSSSAQITKNFDTKENTSYIVGYFSQTEKTPAKTTLLAMGDIFLDRYVKQTIDQKGKEYPFADIDRFFFGSDVTLANIEGPFTNFPPKPLDPNNTTFTFDPKLAPFLRTLGINMTSLANNHTLDFGKDGLAQTRTNLNAAHIDFFGDPKNAPDTTRIKNIRGKKIAFLGYHEFAHTPLQEIKTQIQEAEKEADFTIVMPHWGIEYSEQPSQTQKEAAHAFIDAGADLILGAHPHVIQPMEIYQGKIIFYSLGNFLFDQVAPATTEGLAVGVVIEDEKISFTFFPVQTKNLQVHLLQGKLRDTILQKVAAEVPEYAGDIQSGTFSLYIEK